MTTAPSRAEPRPLSPRYNEFGNAAVEPLSIDAIRRVAQTIRWGSRASDKTRIAGYYFLRVLSGLLFPGHDMTHGMYPKYWIGDVRINTPIGSFIWRSRTIDFDIVNPHYEAVEVDAFKESLVRGAGSFRVFVDVGAHIGKFSILAGTVLGDKGRILAIEPEPSNFAALESNIRLNRLENVEALNVACGDQDEVRSLSQSRTNIGAHTLDLRPGATLIPVQVRTLDALLPERGVDHVDVLKLDVEYWEARVLMGARATLEANRGGGRLLRRDTRSGHSRKLPGSAPARFRRGQTGREYLHGEAAEHVRGS